MIYAIEAIGFDRVKFGYSKHIHTMVWRYQAVQTHSPSEVRIIGVIHEGTKADERALLKRWSAFNTHGEWFSLTDELKTFISEHFVSFSLDDTHIALALFLRKKKPDDKLLVNDKRFISLDAPSGRQDELGEHLMYHETVGIDAEQETDMMSKEVFSAANNTLFNNKSRVGDIAQMRRDGYSYQDIGDAFGKSPDAIKNTLARARTKLSKRFNH